MCAIGVIDNDNFCYKFKGSESEYIERTLPVSA